MQSNSFSHKYEFPVRQNLILLQQNYMNEEASRHSKENKLLSLNQPVFVSVNDQLRQLVQNHLDKHTHLTLNAVAERSGVPATTLRRLIQDENRSELAPHSVLSLASFLYKEKRLSLLLNLIEGPIKTLLQKSFDKFIFDDSASDYKLDQNLNALLNDKTTYLVYKICANHSGASLLTIKESFGLFGVQCLEQLISKNVVYFNEHDKLYHAHNKKFTLDLALAHQLSHSLIDAYKPQDVAKGQNLFYSLSEGMSEEGIQKIKKIKKEAIKKVHEVMTDPQSQGQLPYFSLFVSDLIGPTDLHLQNSGVLQ